MDVDVDDQLMRLQRWPRRSPPRPVPQRHHFQNGVNGASLGVDSRLSKLEIDIDIDIDNAAGRSTSRPAAILAHISQIKWIRIYMHDAILNSYDRCCEINNMRLDVYQTNK